MGEFVDRRRISLYLVMALLAWAWPAGGLYAQGLEAGGLQLSPSLRLMTGYDTNVFYRSESAGRLGAARMDIAPSLGVNTLDPRLIDLSGRTDLLWEQYLVRADEDAAIREISGLEALAHLQARIGSDQDVSFMPSWRLRRSNDPNSNASGDVFRSLINELRGEIAYHPGGARRQSRMGLSGHLSGFRRTFRLPQREALNRDSVGVEADLYWNFLPKTAIFVETSYQSTTWQSDELGFGVTRTDGEAERFTIANVNSRPLRFAGGFAGLLTRRFGLVAKGGFGRGNYAQDDPLRMALGEVRLNFYASPRTTLSTGYNRDFADSNLGSFLTWHRGFLELTGHLRDIELGGEFYVQANQYARIDDPTVQGVPVFGVNQREDILVGAVADITWYLSRYFGAGLSYRLESRDSNFRALNSVIPDLVEARGSASFLRHAVFGTLTFRL
jgi:hypothetical protein